MCTNTDTMTTVDPKIIDLLKEKKEQTPVSLEYFPPRTEDGVKVRHSQPQCMYYAFHALLYYIYMLYLAYVYSHKKIDANNDFYWNEIDYRISTLAWVA